MKRIISSTVFFLLLLPAVHGQTYAFDSPVSYNAALHTVNNKLLLVNMTKNRMYECLAFDTSLNLLYRWPVKSIREMGLLRTNFISNGTGLICIEQVASPGKFSIHLSLLDEKGMPLAPPRLLQFADSSDVRTTGQGFRFALSPDKKILLLWISSHSNEGLSTFCITLDDNLQLIRKAMYAINTDAELEDFRVLEPANDGTLFFLKTDKFYNYRLGSKVSLFATQPGTNELLQKEITLAKKKIRSVNIADNGTDFILSAFCSTNDPEPKVSSFITIELNKKMQAPAVIREYSIAKDLGKKLTSKIPGISQAAAVNNIEIIASAVSEKGSTASCVYGPVYAGRFLDVNSYNFLRNNFGGPGFTPYATSYNQRPYARVSYLNMLSFRTDTITRKLNLQLQRIEKMEETFYRTWIKLLKEGRYYHFVYTETNTAKMVFTSFTFNENGKLLRQAVFSHKEITIDMGLPAVFIHNNLLAFYYNKATEETGLIKLPF